MGRPQKLTLDFFIHDAHASDDRKLKRLERRFHNNGYATFFKLLERLCQESGMKLSLNDAEDAEIVADDCNLRDCPHLYSIIQFCADIGLLNKQLWESERIVFSDAFHERYVSRLKQREIDARRKRQTRSAKALQEKINSIDEELSAQTTLLSGNVPNGCPRTEDRRQRSEDRDQKTEIREQKTSSSEEVQENPKTEAVVRTDRFFGQPKTVRRIEMVRTTPRWDEAAPWRDDGERKQFDEWLRKKYQAKNDPARYAAAIVGKTAKGEPIVDWEEFKARSTSNSKVQVLTEWGGREDWGNFPLLGEWSQQHHEIGANAFVSLGGRNSPQHRFSDWLVAQEVAC